MELTPIGKEKLEIMLTQKDMERFRLSAEQLDYKNTETRRAVWTILDTAKRKTGFDAAKGQIRIDALPGKGGGCVIFITKTEKNERAEKTMNNAKDKAESCEKCFKSLYAFASISDLLAVCRFLRERSYRGESAAFAETNRCAKNKYYLSLSEHEKNPHAVFESMFISEFGKKLSEEHALAYIKEHSICICEKNAVKTLAKMA
jgi:negative regulator of genetic competence, sporulation and motility